MKLKYITTLMIAALISTAALSQSTKEINVAEQQRKINELRTELIKLK